MSSERKTIPDIRFEPGENVTLRYPGGAIYIATLDAETPTHIYLRNALWVADSGRWGLLVAGTPDDNCQWEPMGEITRVPQAHAELSKWPHELPVGPRPAISEE